VDLGLIDAADVLFVQDCPNQGASNFEVDLAGVPGSEVVIFVSGTAVPGFFGGPVPAISVVGAGVLALLLLGACTWALRSKSSLPVSE